MRDSEAGALTKYFGKKINSPKSESAYKYRRIECRQRSTPAFIERVQKRLVETVDEYQAPERVCDVLALELAALAHGKVDPRELAIKNRISKRLEEYTQQTTSVAALERAGDLGMEKHPGENVSYVVVDDEKSSRERVKLIDERPQDGEYDIDYYQQRTIRAAESVLAPLGWRREDLMSYLAKHEDATITALPTEWF